LKHVDDVGKRFSGSFLRIVKNPRITEPIVSPVSSSSPNSTQRTQNGGSKWAKPSSGGLEQLVTNYRANMIIFFLLFQAVFVDANFKIMKKN
jgi:hypothetical protein